MSLLGFLLRRSRGVIALSVVAATISGVGAVGLIALVHDELGRAAPSARVLGWAFFGLALLVAAMRVVAQAAMARLGQGIVAQLAVLLCRKLAALPLARFEELDTSHLLAVLTEDIVIVAGALVGIPQVYLNGPLVAACFADVGWLSPTVLACGAAFVALAVAAYLALLKPAMNRLEAARSRQDQLVGHFRTLIDAFRELKQHRCRRAAFLERALEPTTAAVQDCTVAGQTLFALTEGWSDLAFFGFLGVLLFLLPAFRPVDRATLGGVVLVGLFLMDPLGAILTWMPMLGRARVSLGRVRALIPVLEVTGPEPPRDGSPGPDAFRESLRLEGVTYAYRPEPDGSGIAVGPIDLVLRRGELVFLTGGNGSGKTTLVKPIAGLYAPDDGAIRLDGRSIGPEQREAYRQLFSVVFADGYLFGDLLGLDRPGLDAQQARAGLERLGLGGRVRVERGAFSTLDLSQSQRRRLALLTALLEDRPICIFDEWAANQDRHFKRVFYQELLPELKAAGRALIIISHDEEYYDPADCVLRVRDGLIAEQAGALAAPETFPAQSEPAPH